MTVRQFVLVIALLAPSAPVTAYEVVEVQNGQKVAGSVTLKGTPPPTAKAVLPRDLDARDKHFCGGKQPLLAPLYQVDVAGGLRDVVVWLEGVVRGRAPARETRPLVNESCRFLPLVQTIDVGAELQVENHDPILHNTHPIYFNDQTTLFNLAMPEQGQTARKKVRRAGVMKVQCDAGHVWMRAWIHAFKHPYHTVTPDDGSFTIEGVPPGRYTLHVWHEAAGTQKREIEVGAAGALQANFTLEVK